MFLPLLSVSLILLGRDHHTSIIYDPLTLKVEHVLNCDLIKVQASWLDLQALNEMAIKARPNIQSLFVFIMLLLTETVVKKKQIQRLNKMTQR